MSTSILENKPWICSCCPTPCTTFSLKVVSSELFTLLEKALLFDARIFFGLCCDSGSNGFCVAAQFFQQAENIRAALTKSQIRKLKDVFTQTWGIINFESFKQKKYLKKRITGKNGIYFKCICGSDINLNLSEAELRLNATYTDPFPITVSHKNRKGEECHILIYISKHGEIRSVEPINGIIRISDLLKSQITQ
ncbi:MAG: hypothetical protein ACFFC7_00475 [Candidatus Hermodarchaeota archaeon]